MAYKYSPCNNCSDRCYKCHTECERYKLYVEERKIENERRRKAREQEKALGSERYYRNIYRENKSKIFKSPKK